MAQFWDNVCDASPIVNTVMAVVLGCMLPMIYVRCWRSNEWILKVGTTLMTLSALLAFLVISGLVLDTVCIVPNAKAALKKVGLPKTSVACYMPRNDIVHDIQDMLRSQSVPDSNDPRHPGGYFIIEGQRGCGKTTILKQALTEIGAGVLYVPVDVDGDVSVSLYRSLKINEFCERSLVRLYSYI